MRWLVLWTTYIPFAGADPTRLRAHDPGDAAFAEASAARPAPARPLTESPGAVPVASLRPAVSAVDEARRAVESAEVPESLTLPGTERRTNTSRKAPQFRIEQRSLPTTGANAATSPSASGQAAPKEGPVAGGTATARPVAGKETGAGETTLAGETETNSVKSKHRRRRTTPVPDQSVEDAMEEEKKKPSKSAAHKEVAIVLSTMKWIDEHLSSLGQDRQNMKTAEAKRAATRAQAHKELSAKMDAKHSISVQYLQSLDYDKEIAP